MTSAKMSLWHLLDPLRPDSLFSCLSPTYAQMAIPLPQRGIDNIPPALASLCSLDSSSTNENNSYFNAAHALALIPEKNAGVGYTEPFHRHMHSRFRHLLLAERDPVALVLLYIWFEKSRRGVWWIELRARVESPAICTYLRAHHGDKAQVLAFLPAYDHVT